MTQSLTTVSLPSKWTAAEQAVQAICEGKGNFGTLGQLIGCLFDLGLGGLVEPVVESLKIDSPQWLAERGAILEAARKVSGCTLTWESREKLFSENIAALAPENPTLAGLEDFWKQHRDRYSLFRANDANFQVVDKQAPGIFAGFVGGLADHRALTRFWTYTCTGLQMPRPIAFDGAGYGWLLVRVLESTNRTFLNFSTAVYVIEPDLISACILMNLHDLRPWRNRLRLFVGPDALRNFERALDENSHWALPVTMMGERIQPRPLVDLQSPVLAVAEKRKQRGEAFSARIQAHYHSMTIQDWADRYDCAINGKKPLKILGLTSRFTTVLQYSMDELGESIRAAGHEFVLCKEDDDHCLEIPDLQMIAEHKPDLIVLISRLRHENPRLPKNVPFLCWDQDNLPCMRTEAAGKNLDALTYVAGLGARWGYEHLDWPRQNCILAFQAGATHRYHSQPVSISLFQKHRCTFSYTSNASGSPESLAEEQRVNYARDPRALALFNRMSDEVLSRSKTGYAWDTARVAILLDARIKENDTPLSAAMRQEMIIHLRLLSDRAFRHVALSWVTDYCRRKNVTLRLYGKGWESNPQFAEYAAGFLAPGEEMRALYQASDINLQIIETGLLHSRVLDGLAAGGFFLYRLAPEASDIDRTQQSRSIMTRRALETGCVTFGQLDASTDPLIAGAWAYARSVIPLGKADERCRMLDIWQAQPSEEMHFPGLDEITFGGQEQFNVMADQYLANTDLRHSVAARLRQVVIDDFSYDSRWRQFLSGICAGLRNAADAMKDSGANKSRSFTIEARAA
jgi:hypothetical protein